MYRCPRCNSTDHEVVREHHEDEFSVVVLRCKKCGEEWEEEL